jgi:hypothetical protein
MRLKKLLQLQQLQQLFPTLPLADDAEITIDIDQVGSTVAWQRS